MYNFKTFIFDVINLSFLFLHKNTVKGFQPIKRKSHGKKNESGRIVNIFEHKTDNAVPNKHKLTDEMKQRRFSKMTLTTHRSMSHSVFKRIKANRVNTGLIKKIKMSYLQRLTPRFKSSITESRAPDAHRLDEFQQLPTQLQEESFEKNNGIESKMFFFVELLRENAKKLNNDVQIDILLKDSLTLKNERAVIIAKKEAWFAISNLVSDDKNGNVYVFIKSCWRDHFKVLLIIKIGSFIAVNLMFYR